MTFGEPHRLWLLLVIPPAICGLLCWGIRVRRRLRSQFVPPRLLPNLLAGCSSKREWGRIALLTAASAFLVVGLARPQWGHTWDEVRERGLDIVVVVDVSKSMLAADVQPNRLGRAKLAVLDLVKLAKSDRLALVAFAGSAILLCPLTWDESVFVQTLHALDVGTVSDTGTSLASGLETALRAFQPGVDHYRVVVLLSDGEDHEGGALEAARHAASQGVRLFTLGVGTKEGDLLRVRDAQGREEYVRDETGQVVKSRLNESLLQEMAMATPGGFYLPLQGPRVMETLYERGLADMPRGLGAERLMRRPREQYHWALILALLCLTAEWLWPERPRQQRVPKVTEARTKVAVVVLWAWTPLVLGSPAQALREYQQGRYDVARRHFEALLEKRPQDERLRFNAGTAAYRQGQFDTAASYFEQATRSPDLKLQEWAYYNLGNSLYRLGEHTNDLTLRRQLWQEAFKQYSHALRLNTNNLDAHYNLEFVRQRLEELPPPPSHPQAESGSGQQQSSSDSQSPALPQGSQAAQGTPGESSDELGASEDSVQDRPGQASSQDRGEVSGGRTPSARPSGEDSGSEVEQAGRSALLNRMTAEQAEQLLDTLRSTERRLPTERELRGRAASPPRKNW
ncbi:MAG: VWA domain-containing protein [Verrucomicrobiota bacterium]|nr:VWA domain-containing protein [Limisphaera sp.]MDW8380628.1 VWA domain-containing protein [Verrucomicrobiota bacterium]